MAQQLDGHSTAMPPLTYHVITTTAMLALLWWGRSLLAPLCLAGFAALALAPLVATLTRWVPRSVAAFVVVGAFLAVLGSTAYFLADDAARAIEGMPKAARELRQTIEVSSTSSRGPLASINRAINEVERLWQGRPSAAAASPDLRQGLLVMGARAMVASTQAVVLTFLIYFLLATGDSLKAKLVHFTSARLSQRRITIKAVDEITAQVGYFVVYLIVSGVLVGVTTWLVFLWLGVAYASLWGVAAGLLNAVPYLGPAIIMIASTAAALIQFQSPGTAVAVGGASLAITSFEGMVLTPWLFGRLVRIHPVAVFLSIMFWGWLWGPIGTFLAVPIVTALKVVVDLLPKAGRTLELLSDGTEVEES